MKKVQEWARTLAAAFIAMESANQEKPTAREFVKQKHSANPKKKRLRRIAQESRRRNRKAR